MPNPFDILPSHLFNLFTTQGFATLQRHYMAILIRIYSLAEFNRFGLARETVIAEIMDYIKEADAESEVEERLAADAMEIQREFLRAHSLGKSEQLTTVEHR